MTSVRDLNIVRATVKKQLGAGVLKELHRENRYLDAAGVAACLGAMAGFLVLLARLPFGFAWLLCFAGQGFALQASVMLSHDAFIHRRIWGDRGSWIGAMVLSFPVLLRPASYAIFHADHHAYIGTEKDTETFKQNLDTLWKRVFFLTLLGDRLARIGKLSKNDAPVPVILPKTERERRRMAAEKAGLAGFLLTVAALSVFFPGYVLEGYVLPLLIATPLASTMRIILEHGDVDEGNEFHLGTYYRTGLATHILFVVNSGDCHLIHHIFDHIPWYRMAKAAKLMRPVLIEKGVIERRSLLQLLSGWFVHGFPHRSLWFSQRLAPDRFRLNQPET
jgi:fatty acid desaturase